MSFHATVAPNGTEVVKGGTTGPNRFGIAGRTTVTQPECTSYGDTIKAIGSAETKLLTAYVAGSAAG